MSLLDMVRRRGDPKFRSLLNEDEDDLGSSANAGGGDEMATPVQQAAPTAAVEEPIDVNGQFPAVDRSRLTSLEQQQADLTRPMTLKQKLIKAALFGAPMLLGGAFGGVEGAGAAGAAVQDEFGREEKQKEFNQTNLTRELGLESRNVMGEERMRAMGMENARRDTLAQRRLDQIAANQANIDERTRGHYGEEEKHWANEDNKPRPFNLEQQLYDADSAAHPEDLTTPQGKLNLLKRVQEGAHPYHVPPINFQILPTATGGVGGVFNPRDPKKLLPPPDNSAAPEARKSAEPPEMIRRQVQSTAIGQSEQELFGQIDKVAKQNGLGPAQGRWTSFHQFLGDASPEAMELKGKMTSHFSLIPAMHGMRSNQMVEMMDKKYGNFKFTSDALKGAIRGLSGASKTLGGAIQGVYGPLPNQGGEQPQGNGQPDYIWDPRQMKLVPAGVQ